MKFIFILFFTFIFTFNAHADEEWGNYFKFTCMPELNYMEVTSVYTEGHVDKEIVDKYFSKPDNMKCRIWDKEITLKFEKIPVTCEMLDEKGRVFSSCFQASSETDYKIDFLRDGIKFFTIDRFGAYGHGSHIPNILTFDGANIIATINSEKMLICNDNNQEFKCQVKQISGPLEKWDTFKTKNIK